MIEKPSSVLRETDDEARRLARVLMRSAPYAAMAVLDPESGFPVVSRVLLGTDIDGVPVILVSGLSAHTRALANDARASLLTGEPGKGDPLAHPRLSVECLAEAVAHGTQQHERIRTRFLARHAKAKLYIDFADFQFFRLRPQAASLNGGFGKAYRLTGDDLTIVSDLTGEVADRSHSIVQDLLGSYRTLPDLIAAKAKHRIRSNWRIYAMDIGGFDLISDDHLLRYEFEEPLHQLADLKSQLPKIANPVP